MPTPSTWHARYLSTWFAQNCHSSGCCISQHYSHAHLGSRDSMEASCVRVLVMPPTTYSLPAASLSTSRHAG